LKIRTRFKTTDALEYALAEQCPSEERDVVEAACRRFIRHGECIEIEIDTEAGTAVVLPC